MEITRVRGTQNVELESTKVDKCPKRSFPNWIAPQSSLVITNATNLSATLERVWVTDSFVSVGMPKAICLGVAPEMAKENNDDGGRTTKKA